MKKLTALVLALLLMTLTLTATAQTATLPELGLTFEVPEDFEAYEVTEEDAAEGLLVDWGTDELVMLIYVEDLGEALTMDELQAMMAEEEENIVPTTVNGMDMLCMYNTVTEEDYSYIVYAYQENTILVEIMFQYAPEDQNSANLTAQIMNSIAK